MNELSPLMLPASPSIDAAISFDPDSDSSVAARIDSASPAVSVNEVETISSSAVAVSSERSCSAAPSQISSAVFAMVCAAALTCSACPSTDRGSKA
jgi:hypothetical protein